MPAYVVVQAVITDWHGFSAYSKRVPEIVTQYGGEYLVLGGQSESLEGDWGEVKIVLHRWADMDAARKFWESPEYEEAKKMREGTGDFRVMLVDGLDRQVLE